jgi:multidrug resistance efflux pump
MDYKAEIAHLVARLDALQANERRLIDRLAASEKDAERYRKLRNRAFVSAPMVVEPFNQGVTYTAEGLDAALDALPAVGAA